MNDRGLTTSASDTAVNSYRPPNAALQRTRAGSVAAALSFPLLGRLSPLNARPLGDERDA
jgi:hypothetical protein